MKIPQFVAESALPASSGQQAPGRAAFGAEVFEGLGEVGRQALAIVAQAEEQKADLIRSDTLMKALNQTEVAYADFERQQKENPNAETHVEERDEFTRKHNDRLLGKINDPLVKKAAITHLENRRTSFIVKGRDEARQLAVSQALDSSAETLKIIKAQAAESYMNPETVAESLDGIDTIYDSLIDGGALDIHKGNEMRRKEKEDLFEGGLAALVATSPAEAYRLAGSEEAVEHMGREKSLMWMNKAISQARENETWLEREANKKILAEEDILHRGLFDTQNPLKGEDIDALADKAFALGAYGSVARLQSLRASWAGLREKGGVAFSDPETVVNSYTLLYTSLGSGMSFGEIANLFRSGKITEADMKAMSALKDSLEGRGGALSAGVTRIRELAFPGMMEDLTSAHKTTFNNAVQELMERTNNGAAPKEQIAKIVNEISNRLIAQGDPVKGASAFTSLEDIEVSVAKGRTPSRQIATFGDGFTVPPKWDSPEKVHAELAAGRISESMARYLNDRFKRELKKKEPKGKK